MDDWIAYLEAEPKSEPFLSIAAAWKADKARLASVERERDEIMAMAERREEALQARLAEAEQFLRELIALNLLHDERDRAAVRRFLSKADSASACQHEWRPYAFHPNGGPASYYCPLCRVNRAPTATEIQKSSVPDQPTEWPKVWRDCVGSAEHE